MRLNLREIIHVPGASLPFQFQLDLSGEDFFRGASHPPAGDGDRTRKKTWRMCWSWKGKPGLCWTKPVTGA